VCSHKRCAVGWSVEAAIGRQGEDVQAVLGILVAVAEGVLDAAERRAVAEIVLVVFEVVEVVECRD